jgi:hypothetical protein
MQKLTQIGVRVGALGAVALLCTGCPNPNTYGTPRTTPAGKVSHTVAAEGFRYGVDDESATAPSLPTYQIRVGVLDNLDIGARVANLTSFGADVKWNFIKSDVFDLAIDPGFQVFHISTSSNGSSGSFTEFFGHVPVIFGINVADSVTIVPTAGITYGFNSATVSSGDASDRAAYIDGIMLRGGLGFNFRISPKFAMQPEVTYLKLLNKDTDPSISWVVFGLGFNFGNLPQYGAAKEPEAK